MFLKHPVYHYRHATRKKMSHYAIWYVSATSYVLHKCCRTNPICVHVCVCVCAMTRERNERNRYDLLGGRNRFQDHFTRDLTAFLSTMFAKALSRILLSLSLSSWSGVIDVTKSHKRPYLSGIVRPEITILADRSLPYSVEVRV